MSQEHVETLREVIVRSVVADVRGVFAALRPFRRNAERVADALPTRLRSRRVYPSFADAARLRTVRWPRPGPVGVRFSNASISARRTGRSLISLRRQVELQQAHRAFDVHADRAGINVRRRNQHATDRRAVAAVGVGIEHEIGHAGRGAGVDRLLEAHVIERVANGVRADDGDRFAFGVRDGENGCGFARRLNGCIHHFFLRRTFIESCSGQNAIDEVKGVTHKGFVPPIRDPFRHHKAICTRLVIC